jgi:ABC-type multidrug transport system fused ATPase/permease subunit
MGEAMRQSFVNFHEISELSTIFSAADKFKLRLVVVLQVLLSLLDLVGVALIGIVGALTINGVRSQTPTGRVSSVLEFLNLDELSFQNQTVILSISAVFLLVVRTILSVLITRRTLFFLSRRSAEISSRLISQVMAQPLVTLSRFSSQHIHYTLSTGSTSLTLGVFGNLVSIISDSALLIVLGIGIFVIDPLIAIFTVSVFGTIMVVMYFLTNSRTIAISKKFAETTIKDSEVLLELLAGYREAFIRNRRGFFVDRAKTIKWDLADSAAELAWLPNISKYVIEIAFTVGTMAVAGLQFVVNDSAQAVGSLSLFLAAGTRITPALLRVQQNLVNMNGSLARAKPTIELFSATDSRLTVPTYFNDMNHNYPGFSPSIQLEKVFFSYPDSPEPTLYDINISVDHGQTVAIVGPSGAGKSTLVDLILGVHQPSTGLVRISGLPPAETISKWPGAIGYVPQEVVLRSGSIASNVSSGFENVKSESDLVSDAIDKAQLRTFVKSLPEGAETNVGERGSKLSGGQRQRIGIARALFTRPKLLVLDEATSALDGQTESDISDAIQGLKGKVTLILIAHRLSTVMSADLIIYLEAGRIRARGSFDEVRAAVPDFDKQAKIMGL